MNKRLPLLLSLIGVILLAASLAYWILQLYQPPQRPIAAVPASNVPEPSIDAAATLFGGQVAVASATNYQLTGIVAAGRESVAILVADNAPPKALKVGKEVSPGVTLAEVHPRYVMLSDGGVMKRVDLAADAKAAAPMGAVLTGVPGMQPGNVPQGAQGARPMPPQQQAMTPAGTPAPQAAPNANLVPEPPMSPGAVSQQQQQQPVPEFVPPGDVGPREAPAGNQNAPQMPAAQQPTANPQTQ
ncbi:type II secretion system protein N [Massilia sp. TN1-12]|uniref:type II secretion system protein N n=1 Tax=Massilia paldalensis TaxID=3377675 RepID=UPI00384F9F38